MVPQLVVQIGLIVIVGHSVYRAAKLIAPRRIDWLELVFQLSVGVVALAFLLP
ncbi:hypothetical protein B5M42_014300 [Paenibacillus athensensis]|uniref:hypothetical protein n=1 Tax=Paenibacillus athensensis TaxID=1967502 RepID=UPI00142F791B|nr:hypothetical protein [Paenibacillus athensensis]MCD1259985.1 hypothetical protein [Paenibacillus athensensis]